MGDTDAFHQLEKDIIRKMPWIRSILPPTSNSQAINKENTSVLRYLSNCYYLDRLIIADQTRRVWLTARTLREKLNNLAREFLALTNSPRRQLTVLSQ
jgi:hypothetical protein